MGPVYTRGVRVVTDIIPYRATAVLSVSGAPNPQCLVRHGD